MTKQVLCGVNLIVLNLIVLLSYFQESRAVQLCFSNFNIKNDSARFALFDLSRATRAESALVKSLPRVVLELLMLSIPVP